MAADVPMWMSRGENRRSSTTWKAVRAEIHSSADLFDARGQLLHEVVHRPVLTNHARDLRGRVDNRGVVATAELLADLRQRRVGEFARQVHRDLPWIDDVLRALVAAELVEREAEAVGDGLLDPL